MYAVIRTGGKQYRVAPGDVISIEKTPVEGSTIEFTDIVAVGNEGGVAKPSGATVTGTVLAEERGDKILVFHFKRKKQYKKLLGHRQALTRVRIAEISVDGEKFSAPEGKAFTPKTSHAPKHHEVKAKTSGPRAQRAGEASERDEAPRAAAAKKTAAKKKATTKKK